mmetsp:Transcript_15533/g.49081  ORF Transcript_15533/g.49081 Transcript_15533/m.49081 type:complete len:233 (+) Transcript_15533:286-984(+)
MLRAHEGLQLPVALHQAREGHAEPAGPSDDGAEAHREGVHRQGEGHVAACRLHLHHHQDPGHIEDDLHELALEASAKVQGVVEVVPVGPVHHAWIHRTLEQCLPLESADGHCTFQMVSDVCVQLCLHLSHQRLKHRGRPTEEFVQPEAHSHRDNHQQEHGRRLVDHHCGGDDQLHEEHRQLGDGRERVHVQVHDPPDPHHGGLRLAPEVGHAQAPQGPVHVPAQGKGGGRFA